MGYSKKRNKNKNDDPIFSSEFKTTMPTLEMFELTQEKITVIQAAYSEYKEKYRVHESSENRYMKIMIPLCIFGVLGVPIDDLCHSQLGIKEGFITGAGFIIIGLIITWQLYSYTKNKRRPKFKYTDELERYEKYNKAYQEYEWWQRHALEQYWKNLSGRQFELEIAKLYQGLGYSAEICRQGGDEGIDIILERDSERIAVQCKAHNNRISPSVARDLAGTMLHHKFEHGIIASTNGFTNGTIDFCRNKKIKLISMNEILEMYEELKKSS